MKLARQFKFYYVGMPDQMYTAYYDDGDVNVMVYWHWGNAPFDSGSVPYEPEMVRECITEGDWIITEVVDAAE